MEVCVPLLTVKYLPWRSTLYAAVCQCYFDGKSGAEAEVSSTVEFSFPGCLLQDFHVNNGSFQIRAGVA